MENNAKSKLPWKCNKYTWIGHWTVNMEDGQATQKQCKSNDASCVCNGAAAAMMLNESVELRLSWKLGRETVGCGLAGCATNTGNTKYKHKHKCKYKYKNKFYKLGREMAGCATNTENTNTDTNSVSWADWMRTCGVRNKYFHKDW